MEDDTVLYGIVICLWIQYTWEIFLSHRQYLVYQKTTRVPQELEDVLDHETFEKARQYSLDKSTYGFWSGIYSQLETTAILLLGGLPWLWDQSEDVLAYAGFRGDHEIKQTAIFIFLASLVSLILDLPWNIYYTFRLEQKHGFNKMTGGFYVKDKMKKFLVIQLLMQPISLSMVLIIKIGGDYFFVYAWLFTMAVSLFLVTIYADYIAPLFDTYKPLADGDLKTAIEALAASIEFPLTKLYVVEGSKRSAHSNAYFYGFHKNKRIVLFDTLLKDYKTQESEASTSSAAPSDDDASVRSASSNEEKKSDTGCTDDEILGVLAHELGHWKLNHVTKNIVISQVNMLFSFAAFGYLYQSQQLYNAFGFTNSQPVFIGMLIVFQYVFSPYNEIFMFLLTVLSRKFEFQADAFAATLGRSEALGSALIKLNKDNLGFPVYDWLFSSWHHSHPPLIERLRAIKKTQ